MKFLQDDPAGPKLSLSVDGCGEGWSKKGADGPDSGRARGNGSNGFAERLAGHNLGRKQLRLDARVGSGFSSFDLPRGAAGSSQNASPWRISAKSPSSRPKKKQLRYSVDVLLISNGPISPVARAGHWLRPGRRAAGNSDLRGTGRIDSGPRALRRTLILVFLRTGIMLMFCITHSPLGVKLTLQPGSKSGHGAHISEGPP